MLTREDDASRRLASSVDARSQKRLRMGAEAVDMSLAGETRTATAHREGREATGKATADDGSQPEKEDGAAVGPRALPTGPDRPRSPTRAPSTNPCGDVSEAVPGQPKQVSRPSV